MRARIAETGLDDKVCRPLDLGMVQEVIAPGLIAEVVDTYQMWEEREQKTNMVSIVYWLIALHLYPRLAQRRVYGKLVSGQRTWRDDVAEQIPVRSAFSSRREQLGSAVLQELFARCAGPKASEQTPGAFCTGLRLLGLDGTVESVPDTPANRAAFRYSSADATSHSPFPQARLVLLVECGTQLICDAQVSAGRGAQPGPAALALESARQSAAVGHGGSCQHRPLCATRARRPCAGTAGQHGAAEAGGHAGGWLAAGVALP